MNEPVFLSKDHNRSFIFVNVFEINLYYNMYMHIPLY